MLPSVRMPTLRRARIIRHMRGVQSVNNMSPKPPDLSIVVPMFDEEENVRPLYDRLVAELSGISEQWEVVLVDDGSHDRTLERLVEIAHADRRFRVVAFRRNYGQTPAMVAGIEHARGDVVLTMDGDLQNDPADIPRFLEQINLGYDIVVGWREKRKDALVSRKIPSKIANWIIGKVTGVPIRDNGCSLKAYRANVIKNIPLYSEMHRFIPAMASLAGSRILEIPVRHHARVHGESKYGLKRIYKVLLDLIVVRTIISCLGNPLRYFGTLALFPIVFGLAFAAASLIVMHSGESGVVLMGSAILWITFGMFSILWGVLGELIYKTTSHKEPFLARLTTTIG